MSLRVLLADESASIRKVFQMGLQDYGAEVKSVHNGLDVVEVAQSYKPDIIFADILLQKKNGYEVSQEIIQHGELGNVPVVLMWSSFMELDQSKYQGCGAKGELEKPFDVEKMRSLIQSLVSETQTQQLSGFLNFPNSISKDFVEEENAKIAQATQSHPQPPSSFEVEENDIDFSLEDMGAPPPPSKPPEFEKTSEFNMQADASSEFQMYEVDSNTPPLIPLDDAKTVAQSANKNTGDSWEAKPLNDMSIHRESATDTDQDLENFQSMDLGSEKKLNLDDFLYKPESGMVPPSPGGDTARTGEIHNVKVSQHDDNPNKTVPAASIISPEEAEAIIRAETRATLNGIIKDQLPGLLEKVVRDELEKILQQEMALKGTDQNPG